jgi:hypothetical protein
MRGMARDRALRRPMQAVLFASIVVGIALPRVAASAKQDHVTICHATGSRSNPFVRISPSVSGVYHGHYRQHDGDIIPPFEYGGQTYSLNWDAAGRAIWNNGCEALAPPAPGQPPQVLPKVVHGQPPFTG